MASIVHFDAASSILCVLARRLSVLARAKRSSLPSTQPETTLVGFRRCIYMAVPGARYRA